MEEAALEMHKTLSQRLVCHESQLQAHIHYICHVLRLQGYCKAPVAIEYLCLGRPIAIFWAGLTVGEGGVTQGGLMGKLASCLLFRTRSD